MITNDFHTIQFKRFDHWLIVLIQINVTCFIRDPVQILNIYLNLVKSQQYFIIRDIQLELIVSVLHSIINTVSSFQGKCINLIK